MDKSSRHSKIAGDFGESLLLYWLSKSGFEVALVDHTGIDIVAYCKKTKRRLGISVKTRTRNEGNKNEGLYIKPTDEQKVTTACKYFACEEYWGIIIDRNPFVEVIMLSQKDLLKINGKGKRHINFKVTDKFINKYKKLPGSIYLSMNYEESRTF